MRGQLSSKLLELKHPDVISEAYAAADQLATGIVPHFEGECVFVRPSICYIDLCELHSYIIITNYEINKCLIMILFRI